MSNDENAPTAALGGCLCGAIRYRVSAPITKLIICHCTDCQKASGAGASANAMVPSDSFEIVKGEPGIFSKVVDSGNTLHRAFCRDCGSPIFSRRDNLQQVTGVKVGTLDEPVGMQVAMNIWTRSARPWVHIDPAVQSYPQGRPMPPPAPAA